MRAGSDRQRCAGMQSNAQSRRRSNRRRTIRRLRGFRFDAAEKNSGRTKLYTSRKCPSRTADRRRVRSGASEAHPHRMGSRASGRSRRQTTRLPRRSPGARRGSGHCNVSWARRDCADGTPATIPSLRTARRQFQDVDSMPTAASSRRTHATRIPRHARTPHRRLKCGSRRRRPRVVSTRPDEISPNRVSRRPQ